MSESLLQAYLTSQHIKITDESNVENLKKSVSEIRKQLEKKREKIISYTLVGLDPQINDSDPVVQEVEQIIIKKWSTFKNSVTATKDKSITYIRAVILETLYQISKADDTNAALIWHTSRDVVSYYELGNEKDQISRLLQEIANNVERIAQKKWGIVNQLSSTSFQGINISLTSPIPAKLNGDQLTVSLKTAFIYSGLGNGGGNPSYPGYNDINWPKFAAEQAAKSISEEVNKTLTQQSKSLVTITESIKKGLDEYFTSLNPFFESISTSFVTSVIANNRRSELLWWKQSLYSKELSRSYRNYLLIESSFLMSTDLSQMVDPIYPVSVDFLLEETLRDIYGEDINTKHKFKELLNSILKMDSGIQSLVQNYIEDGSGRKPILNGIANFIKSSNEKEFSSNTGIDLNDEISIAELAVWLFHGLQAEKFSNIK